MVTVCQDIGVPGGQASFDAAFHEEDARMNRKGRENQMGAFGARGDVRGDNVTIRMAWAYVQHLNPPTVTTRLNPCPFTASILF